MDISPITPNSVSSLGDEDASTPATSPASSFLIDEAPSYDSTLWGQKQQSKLPAEFPQIPCDETPQTVADADAHTPDNWVKRNPALVRLTGKHPFNAEACLPDLIAAGFLTPAHLHFVRNHGAVPQIEKSEFDSWNIRVHGLVAHEETFSLRDLMQRFETVTLPVTLVCAGNRRKEQNVVRKSLGFHWGSAGVSTALWTGIYLADVLECVKPIRGRAKHVIFEGADFLPKGPYGTSQRLSWSTSREKGILIAWAMNGLSLEPDHGFPVRLIVPGQIGGRSVKWLRRIEVSSNESEHHLHFWDNKVLPRHLSPDIARKEQSWWYDPAFLITELSVNSVISNPMHGEVLEIPKSVIGMDESDMYTLRGYAYSGGGRRVSRCEVSLDEGQSWQLAKIQYPEDSFRSRVFNNTVFGTLDLTERDTAFCWCFWTLEVPVNTLRDTRVIEVCAMDESMNMQPRDIYLNATSMLNNWLFRVAVIKTDNQLLFEHPAPVGVDRPGWMERMKAAGLDVTRPKFADVSRATKEDVNAGLDEASKSEVSMIKASVTRKITQEELSGQDLQRPWFVVNGQVYDGTEFLEGHPGGPDSILLAAGEDATDDFIAIHSADGRAKLAEYHIGTLVGTRDANQQLPKTETEDQQFLDPRRWRRVRLEKLTRINHNCFTYRFDLGSPSQPLGLLCGQHIFVRIRNAGGFVQRAYTPISPPNAAGSVELLIKLYRPNEKFPLGGRMSAAFEQLSLGDEIEIKGPIGSFIWNGGGSYLWRGQPGRVKSIGMISAGSGITPIYQVLRGILHDKTDQETHVWLICSNSTFADILMREELDELFSQHGAHRFKLHHTLSRAPDSNWAHGVGRLDDKAIAAHLPPPSSQSLVLACGPNSLIDETVKPGLQRLGWDVNKQLVVF